MILEIKKYPDSILKKKAKKVEEITPEIKKLGEDMIETMTQNEPEGIGLAAPQVGILKRIIVAQTDGFDGLTTSKGPAVFINPRIVKKSKETEITEEGCLSLPGIWLKIKRAKGVEVGALDINGKKIKINTEGMLARVLQHEIDHIDGVLIIDRISSWQKVKRTLTK